MTFQAHGFKKKQTGPDPIGANAHRLPTSLGIAVRETHVSLGATERPQFSRACETSVRLKGNSPEFLKHACYRKSSGHQGDNAAGAHYTILGSCGPGTKLRLLPPQSPTRYVVLLPAPPEKLHPPVQIRQPLRFIYPHKQRLISFSLFRQNVLSRERGWQRRKLAGPPAIAHLLASRFAGG